jgi:hypothetical protein
MSSQLQLQACDLQALQRKRSNHTALVIAHVAGVDTLGRSLPGEGVEPSVARY